MVQVVGRDADQEGLLLTRFLNDLRDKEPQGSEPKHRPINPIHGRPCNGEVRASRSIEARAGAGVSGDDRRQDPNRRPMQHGVSMRNSGRQSNSRSRPKRDPGAVRQR